jgi:hypothetical protein
VKLKDGRSPWQIFTRGQLDFDLEKRFLLEISMLRDFLAIILRKIRLASVVCGTRWAYTVQG